MEQTDSKRRNAYRARMHRVLEFIDRHPDGNLCIIRLSGIAAFSRFHFQRQFSSLFGISPARYVQLVRLKRASHRLAHEEGPSVTAVALDSGYETPEAFARAFKRELGQTPSGFREQPDWTLWHAAFGPIRQVRSKYMTHRFSDDQIRIVDFPATPVAVMEHRGDPGQVGNTVRRFIAWRKQARLSPATSATFNIFHADPDREEGEAFRLAICAATERDVEPNAEGVVAGMIPGGKCAVLRQTGSGDDLREAARFLYADWLPRSGEELRDFPLFAHRVSFYPQVAEQDAVTDLFLPLR